MPKIATAPFIGFQTSVFAATNVPSRHLLASAHRNIAKLYTQIGRVTHLRRMALVVSESQKLWRLLYLKKKPFWWLAPSSCAEQQLEKG